MADAGVGEAAAAEAGKTAAEAGAASAAAGTGAAAATEAGAWGMGEAAAAEAGKAAAETAAGTAAETAAGTGGAAAGATATEAGALGSAGWGSGMAPFVADSSLALGAGETAGAGAAGAGSAVGSGAAGTTPYAVNTSLGLGSVPSAGAGSAGLGSGALSGSTPPILANPALVPGAASGGKGLGSQVLGALGSAGSWAKSNPLQSLLVLNALSTMSGSAQKNPYEGQMASLAEQQAGSAALANRMGADQYNRYQSGVLPESAMNDLKTYEDRSMREVKNKYAQMGLSGSSMEAADINKVRTTASAMKDQFRQLGFDRALQALGGGGLGNAAQIYSSIANMNMNRDAQLQSAWNQLAMMAANLYGKK